MRNQIDQALNVLVSCAVIALLFAGSAISATAAGEEGSAASPSMVRPPPPAAKKNLVLTGSLHPYESTRLFAKVSGYLEEITVDIGDKVKQGHVLVRLAVPEMIPALSQAEIGVTAAKAHLEKAKADASLAEVTLRRITTLRASEPGAITEQDEDVARSEVQVAKAMVLIEKANEALAQAHVAELKTMMAYTTIVAPFDGTITQRFVDSGALVTSGTSSGSPIVEIVRTDTLRMAVFIPEREVPHVQPPQAVRIALDAFPDQIFKGNIARVSGFLSSDTRSMRAEIDLDNPKDELRPGMFGTVTVIFHDAESSE